MSAGDYEAGAGLAGLDPLPEGSPPRNVRPPHALWFQGLTRDFPLRDGGQYQSTHPIDQEVELAMEVAVGKIPALPSIGLDLAALPLANADLLQAEVERRVNAGRVGALVSAGSIRVVELVARRTTRNGVGVRLQYVNLQDPSGDAREVNVTV
jgi:hypothetical protein